MLVKAIGAALQGIDAIPVTIEVLTEPGIQFVMVGLPDTAVKESAERVASAIQQAGFEFPRRKVVVNMAPGDVRKEGAAYDLPIALGILAASEQINATLLSDFLRRRPETGYRQFIPVRRDRSYFWILRVSTRDRKSVV